MKVAAASLHGITHRIGHRHSNRAAYTRHKHLGQNVALGFAAVLLMAGRLYLPVWVTDHVNNTLNSIKGYTV